MKIYKAELDSIKYCFYFGGGVPNLTIHFLLSGNVNSEVGSD